MSQIPSQIHLLTSDVVDQIAAGEVVERPSHLVKELVENAIDAGATAVEIEFDQGGRRVRVTDDGSGIKSTELKLALSRHATSKIASADDLWNLSTFGFRGEALASIAAVSRLTLTSRTLQTETASRIISEFGKLSSVEPTGANQGTTILIEELFANVPARLKFMKSEAGESAQIKATLRALALANEKVEFRMRTKGKLDAVWPRAQSFLERVRQIIGVEKLYETTLTYDNFEAQVVFAGPHDVAGNARSILIFVQNRWVQDRGLQAAVIDAFRGLLMHGEYPIAVVRLKAPPAEVDVNIHPTKSQIKFRDSQPAFRAVNRALREGIEKAPWLEATPVRSQKTVAEANLEAGMKKLSVADLTRPYEPSTAPSSSLSSSMNEEASLAASPVNSTGRFEAPEFNSVIFRQKRDLGVEAAVEAFSANAAGENPVQSSTGYWSRMQVIGQAHLTYILAQDEGRLMLVDQHAAHERVAYERLMRAWKGGQVDVQTALLPIQVELEADGAEALMKVQDELETLGVVIDQVGPQAVVVRAKPSIISDKAISKALTDLSREITERGGSFVLEKKISDICATMACHSVVRAGQALSIEQMKKLLEQMDEFPLSSFCPHGRPVSIEFPFSKLERDFGRIV
jgi:DNA mismatch repair protein MutL